MMRVRQLLTDNLNLPFYIWLAASLVFLGSFVSLPHGGGDWQRDIGRAARHWWPTPWELGLPIPPWGALLLAPIALLPDRWATSLTNGLSVIVFALGARRLKAPHWIALLVLGTPFGLWMFINGQTEWLVLIGLLVPAGFDLIFILLKPQVAGWLVFSRLRASPLTWKHYAIGGVSLTLGSLLVWGLWPLGIYQKYSTTLLSGGWNLSTWPWGIVIGLVCLALAWKTKSEAWGIAASPFMFPYVNGASYVGAVLALACLSPRIALWGWLIVWLIFIYLGTRA
jgi:hypothetical protein